MQEQMVDIRTADGVMNTYVFAPDGPGPHPVVIHYMDSVGVREELADMCRRVATVGYLVLLPNLYYRKARYVDLDANRLRDPAYTEKLEWMWTLNRSLSNTMIESDTRALFDFIDSEPTARKDRIGIVGYCMSGRFVYRVAGAFPDRIAASASVYGARLVTDLSDSAHLLTDRIKGEMYFACAEHDHYVTREDLAGIEALMKQHSIRGAVEFYPESQHGFAFPKRAVYHKASAERHWERLFDLFRRNVW